MARTGTTSIDERNLDGVAPGGVGTHEHPDDRVELAQDAGYTRFSLLSVLAGTLVALGSVALLLALAVGLGEAIGANTDGLGTDDWRDIGVAAAVVFALILFASYAFGGYVAGRMARRSGLLHGLGVFVVALLIGIGAAAIGDALSDPSDAIDALRREGVPTDADDWRGVGLGAAIAALAATLLGSLLGGLRGERWHGRLLDRANRHAEDRAFTRTLTGRALVGPRTDPAPRQQPATQQSVAVREQPVITREPLGPDGTGQGVVSAERISSGEAVRDEVVAGPEPAVDLREGEVVDMREGVVDEPEPAPAKRGLFRR